MPVQKIRTGLQVIVDQNFDVNSYKLLNVANGTVATDGINLGQLNDAIAGVSIGLNWKDPVFAITADAGLNAASNGTALSTLLPFSDDDGTALVIGDFSDGDYILSKNGTSSKLFYVYDDAGTLKVEDDTGANVPSTMEALAAGHCFWVKNDLTDSPDAQETTALFSYNGTDLVKMGDIDWQYATGIDLSSGYAASAGTVAAGDTVEVAIQKLDQNLQNLIGAVGAATEAAIDYSSNNYVTDATDTVTAIGALDAQVGTNTSNISTNTTNISNLEAAVGSSTGLAGLSYTEQNFVTDGESLESSVDALDIAVGNLAIANQVFGEAPTVTNGSATVTIANAFETGTLRVYLNGVRQLPGSGNDYTVSGTTITFSSNLKKVGAIEDVVILDYYIQF